MRFVWGGSVIRLRLLYPTFDCLPDQVFVESHFYNVRGALGPWDRPNCCLNGLRRIVIAFVTEELHNGGPNPARREPHNWQHLDNAEPRQTGCHRRLIMSQWDHDHRLSFHQSFEDGVRSAVRNYDLRKFQQFELRDISCDEWPAG